MSHLVYGALNVGGNPFRPWFEKGLFALCLEIPKFINLSLGGRSLHQAERSNVLPQTIRTPIVCMTLL